MKLIQRVFHASDLLRGRVTIAYLADYDMRLGSQITTGVDIMVEHTRAATGGVLHQRHESGPQWLPSLSVLDGWGSRATSKESRAGRLWTHIQARAGMPMRAPSPPDWSSTSLHLFHQDRDGFIEIRRQAIALKGSFFNTQRLVQEYVVKAYR